MYFLQKEAPLDQRVRTSITWGKSFKDGTKDFMTIRKRDGQVTYSWFPHRNSTGEYRIWRNVLLAQFEPDAITGLINLVQEDPTKSYDILLPALYPNAFKQLNEGEVLNAIDLYGADILRINKGRLPKAPEKVIKTIEEGLENPQSRVQFVTENSTLKRAEPCAEVEVRIL